MTVREPKAIRTRVSIKDVAQRAGVSIGTVSNVLNRPEIVTEDKRRRVNAAIYELGFVRNEQARHLKSGASRTIAFVVLNAGNPFFTDVAAGIEAVAEHAGLGVYICNTHEQPAREARYLDMLGEQRVRGVLLTPIETDSPDSPRLESLARQGVPLVLVDRYRAGDDHCSVSGDDVLGGQLAVKHLLEGGHRRMVFVGEADRLTQVKDRLAGAEQAIAEAGLPDARLDVILTASMDLSEGQLAAGRILGRPAESRATAAFCANDLLALGLLQEMTRANVRVPHDFAIVGYDDIYFAGSAVVPLSSVRQPREEIGRTAARLLLEEADAPAQHQHRQVRFEPELVVRASSNWRVAV